MRLCNPQAESLDEAYKLKETWKTVELNPLLLKPASRTAPGLEVSEDYEPKDTSAFENNLRMK